MKTRLVCLLAVLLLWCQGTAFAKADLLLEIASASNTLAGTSGWKLYTDGHMVHFSENSSVPQRPLPDRQLSPAMLNLVNQTIERTRVWELPKSIGNGRRGEPTAAVLELHHNGRLFHLEAFNGGDGSDASNRFFQLFNLVSAYSRRPTIVMPSHHQ